MKINQKALKKAREKQDEKDYFNLCINNQVCPKCGEDLKARGIFAAGYKCNCGFEHIFRLL